MSSDSVFHTPTPGAASPFGNMPQAVSLDELEKLVRRVAQEEIKNEMKKHILNPTSNAKMGTQQKLYLAAAAAVGVTGGVVGSMIVGKYRRSQKVEMTIPTK